MRLILLLTALCLALIGCQNADPFVGSYHIEQSGNTLGEGAEMGTLELKADHSFEIAMGRVSLGKGTWKASGNNLELSQGGGPMGASYRLEGGKLVPVVNGKDVTGWRFVRK